jgi:hypothetical protein
MNLRRIGLTALLLACLAGCEKSKALAFHIEATLDQSLVNQSVSLNLVGVNGANKGIWDSKELSRYWEPQDRFRLDAIKRGDVKDLKLGSGTHSARLDRNDPIWAVWRDHGAAYVYLLVQLPDPDHADSPGDTDPWRKVIELDSLWWPKSPPATLRVLVQPSGVSLLDSKLPERRGS